MAWRELIPGDPAVKVYDREQPVRRLTNEEMRDWIFRHVQREEIRTELLKMYPAKQGAGTRGRERKQRKIASQYVSQQNAASQQRIWLNE